MGPPLRFTTIIRSTTAWLIALLTLSCSDGPSPGGSDGLDASRPADARADIADVADISGSDVSLLPERDAGRSDVGPGDHTAPSVRWLQPIDRQSVSGDEVVLSVEALDSRGVASVRFRVADETLAVVERRPFETSWPLDGLDGGRYTLSAEAIDGSGNSTVETIDVQLQRPCDADACPQTEIDWLFPASDEGLCRIVGLEVDVRAAAEVEQVTFNVAGDVVGVVESPPWRTEWDSRSVPDGAVTALARVIEVDGWSTYELLELSVANRGADCDHAPDVRISAPSEGVAVHGPVEVQAEVDGDWTEATLFVSGRPHSSVIDGPVAFLWNSDASSEGGHSVRVVASNAAGRTGDASVDVFVDRSAPTIEITSPFGGSYPDVIPLVASVRDNHEVVAVDWYLSARSSFVELGRVVEVSGEEPIATSGADGTGEFSVEGLASGSHELFAVAYDSAGHSAVSRADFVVDRRPLVELLAPESGSAVEGSVSIEARVVDDLGPAGVRISMDDTTLHETDVGATSTPVDELVRFDWEPEPGPAELTLVVEVTDAAGRTASASAEIRVEVR